MRERQKHNPKHNKELCWDCKYHTYMGNVGKTKKSFDKLTDLEKSSIACYYSVMRNETCLRNVHGKLVDSRGYDYNHCKKFEPDDREDNNTNNTNSKFGKWVVI